MLKKASKRLSLVITLLLFASIACSSGAAVIAETTNEPVTEENQLIKSPEESLPEAPPLLDVQETTNEETETTETSEIPTETQQTQEISEETEASTEAIEETQETIETTESEEKLDKEMERLAPQNTGTGDFSVEGGILDTDYTYADNLLTFVNSGEYRVAGTTTEDQIVVNVENVTLTLAGVKIDQSNNYGSAALVIKQGASATINLIGDNELKSGIGCAGLQNDNNSARSLVITSDAGPYQGYAGSLEATGGNRGAGIGGSQYEASTIEILGGDITATGNLQASGIGGGSNNIGTVTIDGGVVTATGATDGAGIGGGGGADRRSGTVTINGGTISAISGSGGSDIGRGEMERYGTVIINGGNVKTSRGNSDNSIQPSPVNEFGDEVRLCDLIPAQEDAEVLVDGRDYQFIKPHESDENYYLYLTKERHNITLKKNDQQKNYLVLWNENTQEFELWASELMVDHFNGVTYSNNELILSGNNQTYSVSMNGGLEKTTKDRIKITGSNVTVKLNGVKVDVSKNTGQAALLIEGNATATIDLVGKNDLKSGLNCAGLQNDNEADGSLVITSKKGDIEGYAGSLTAIGNWAGAGIGGADKKNGTVSIAGGSITANGSWGGAGIGGGNEGSGTITITGGSITANGSSGGAGIGGGNDGTGTITIDDGKITATGHGTGSGIGGGGGKKGAVSIVNGDIIATGGINGAGIGGGSSANGEVTIIGGDITATSTGSGAGIGGGSGTSNGTVVINGGKIAATGTGNGAGIGGGSMGNGSITITGGTVTATAGNNTYGIGRGQYGNSGEVKIEGGSVKALANGKLDSIDPRPKNADKTELALCNLISFKEDDQILVDGEDYKVNGRHKEDDKAYLYMTKENHKVTVINNGQQKEYSVIWDNQANKFILWTSELMVDNFTGVSYLNNEVILAGDDETYNITMREGVTTTIVDRIKVTGSNVTVKLNDVKIDVSTKWGQAALLIDSDASATVELFGENQLKSGRDCAGLQNDNTSKKSLVINSETGSYQGYAGSLEAEGGIVGAGIGGGNTKGSLIEIQGGLITATGGTLSAGIGGGNRDINGSGSGEVKITGGVIIAKSGTYAAAIGGGFNGRGVVNISGGTITAEGNDYAPGIGDGDQNKDPEGEVNITGGSVKASAKKTPINPTPTSDGTTPLGLYQADASPYTDGSTLKVGTTDWNVAGKHADDDNFYLYLPEEKHVVTVADSESFIEWKDDTFIPASTYTLSIPKTVELKKEGNTEQVKLMNNFHGVSGYNKYVTASLSSNGMVDQNLILKNSGDEKKQAQSLITYAGLTLAADASENKTDLILDSPIGTTGNDPLQAGTYKGSLIFEAELSDAEVTP